MGFFLKYKKIFIAIGFFAISLAIGYLLYFLFFKPIFNPETTITQPTETATTSTGLPLSPTGTGQIVGTTTPGRFPTTTTTPGNQTGNIATGGITRTVELTSEPVSSPVLSANGSSLRYYDQNDGKFYEINSEGQAVALSDKVFYSAQNITWSNDRNKVIIEYPDGSNINYDFATKKQITLPQHWKDFYYSPNDQNIVAKSIGLDPNNRWLITAKDDGSGIRAIEDIGENENIVYPSWSPNGQTIAMYTSGIDFNRQNLLFVGLNGENFKSTIIEGRGLEFQWAPQGDRLLYSVYSTDNDLKPMLWIVNAQGDTIGNNRISLGIETWAEKCTFKDNTTAYCAVPESLPEGAGMFPELKSGTIDQLYEINTQTGLKKLIATPDTNFTMNNLIVSNDGKYLFFTDTTTNRINRINLK
jgi:Tol biopolymer transport system component